MGDSWSGIVDVGSKPIVRREAIATGMILLKSESIDAVAMGLLQGRCPRSLNYFCDSGSQRDLSHPSPLSPYTHRGCHVEWVLEERGLRCNVTVRTHWTTGVEMEALCGVSAGLLCAWDMLKPMEKDEEGQYPEVRIEDIRVLRKKKSHPQD